MNGGSCPDCRLPMVGVHVCPPSRVVDRCEADGCNNPIRPERHYCRTCIAAGHRPSTVAPVGQLAFASVDSYTPDEGAA